MEGEDSWFCHFLEVLDVSGSLSPGPGGHEKRCAHSNGGGMQVQPWAGETTSGGRDSSYQKAWLPEERCPPSAVPQQL